MPDTSTEVGFERWVRNQLGLTYETFTSSVLLLQGKADNLLAAVPAKRFEVLAGVVGLERYQKLHERVETRRKELVNESRTLLQQLNGVRVVEDVELDEADRQITAAVDRRRQAQAEVERLQVLEFQAGRWTELQATLATVRREWQQAQDVIGRADAIERDEARLRELRDNLPRLTDLLEQRNRLESSQSESVRLTAEREGLVARLQETDYALAQVQQKRRTLQEELTACAERRLQLAEERQALALALPLLRQIRRERAQLGQAQEQARAAQEGEQSAFARLAELEAGIVPVVAEWQTAADALRAADHGATKAATLLQEARKRAARFYSVVGEKMCRYCGQPLTPGHVETERAKLDREQADAETQHRLALEAQESAAGAEKRLAARRQQAEQALAEALRQRDDWTTRRREAERDARRHAEECSRAYADLTKPYQSRICPIPPDDWLTTTYPTADDLDSAEQSYQARLKEIDTLQRRGEALGKDLARGQEDLNRLASERESIRQFLAEMDRSLEAERVRREACRENMARIEEALPSAWRALLSSPRLATDRAAWQDELTVLETNGAEALGDRLRQARASVVTLERHKQDLEREQELFPAEARCDPGQVGALLTAARQQQSACEAVLREVQEHKAMLLLVRQQRDRLQEQLLAAERQHKLYQKLAQLLGRDRLQLHLVRQAERGIVEYANAVLGRLSGGQLYLRLCAGEKGEDPADKALQLEALNQAAGQEPIRVEFLSGSQRFRVAVSLALGIGQYASRQHRPVEAVIIDEGFGCLDKTNRQVMIQELQNLRGQLRRILVVSHQEEFATAFADGYHFELVNGTTEVTRFQR